MSVGGGDILNIHGFQKLTLLDYPSKVACIVFTAGCNFRCRFCHNASLVTHIDNEAKINEREIFEYLSQRKGILDGVCVTGGEPLLQNDLEKFLNEIKKEGFSVKIDTNGCYYDKLKSLIINGLVDYVAMDVKNSKEKYLYTVGLDAVDLNNIENSISLLLDGIVEYEFRTTVAQTLHTVEDIRMISEWISGARRYFLQNFVDSGDVICDKLVPVSADTIKRMQLVASKNVNYVAIR